MTESEFEIELQEQANISRIRKVFEKVEEEIKTEKSGDVEPLDFNER